MKYKLGIREAYNAFERGTDDALHTHWLSKNPQEVWRVGRAKFAKKSWFLGVVSCMHF
jgi:hypothetical protein